MLQAGRLARAVSQRDEPRPLVAGCIVGRRKELNAFSHALFVDFGAQIAPSFHDPRPIESPSAVPLEPLQAPLPPCGACESRFHGVPGGSPLPGERTPLRRFRQIQDRAAIPASAFCRAWYPYTALQRPAE